MAASPAEVEDFLAGPLVTWLATCVKKPESLQVYETFFDGGPFNEILLRIDPEPSQPIPTSSSLQGLSITAARIKIFHCIVKNVKAVYEEELGQVVISVPDCVVLGRAPASEAALNHLKLLILLMLGCAVQGPTKEYFITRIKALPLEVQHDIVECIKQVTDDQNIVLTLDWTEQPPQRLYSHVRNLIIERDKLLQQWVIDLGQETVVNGTNHVNNSTEGVESNHLAVELADWKARLRKQRQELFLAFHWNILLNPRCSGDFSSSPSVGRCRSGTWHRKRRRNAWDQAQYFNVSEEKSELLTECREELEHANTLLTKLRLENTDLLTEARRAKAYRDEVDALREKAERAERLEAEVQRYRERLADTEFYRVRVDELREDNRVLLETREMLESQLARARHRADHMLELEAELLSSKQKINEIVLERDASNSKIQELMDENIQLQQVTKSALQETSTNSITDDSDHEDINSGDNSLSEQLTNNAQARALKLELENKKLLSAIESLKERSFHENANKLLELEKDKKRLSLKCDHLKQNCHRLSQQNSELENLFKNAIQENRKLQDSLDSLKIVSDRQLQDLQNERLKICELDKNIDSLTKEKQRVLTLCDTIKNRADNAENSKASLTQTIEKLMEGVEIGRKIERMNDKLKEKMGVMEKDNLALQKETIKLKEALESKDVALDHHVEQTSALEKEVQTLTKENSEIIVQLEKLQECEKRTQELLSQATVHSETISTLQKDLVHEKVNNEKFKLNIEKLGLNLDTLENDINIILEKMLDNSEILRSISTILKEKEGDPLDVDKQLEEMASSLTDVWRQQVEKLEADISSLQHLNENLQTENASLQVDISTLKSQLQSLQTQQTALQLANSQLVAEKEDLSRQSFLQKNQHDTLLLDQVTLRTIHEQLSLEYEVMQNEQENLKKAARDLKIEVRTWKEKTASLENIVSSLEHEKEAMKTDSRNLSNLRGEHSKLKDDFRNLFTASERLKVEYKSVQEELKNLRIESRNFRLGHTEMQGELNSRSDLITSFQLENAKLQQKCDMLYEMNASLDSDRRALMEHVSQLLTQYHSLLTHSLEDKEHYHLEEKMFTDKLNNLCRQKEKLEEKIMEHYKRLDNVTSKKGGFATLVRRVRKAGSDIMNKVPRSNRRSWQEDTPSKQAQPQVPLNGSGESNNGSNGNESDNSTEDSGHRIDAFRRTPSGSLHGHRPRDEVALRRSHRDMAAHRNSIASEQLLLRDTQSALSLGSIGSRRTVYISEDEPNSSPPPSVLPLQSTPIRDNNPPLLVYNRISTVIGDSLRTLGNQTNLPEGPPKENGERKKSVNPKETAVWYEYGCV